MTSPTKSRIVACPNCGTRNRLPASAQGAARCGKCHQPLPWLVDAGDANFSAVVERSTLPVVVEFWAPWCGPCRMVAPALEQMSREFAGRLKVVKVNIDESPATSERFGVMSIPMLLLVRGGKVVDRLVGAAPAPRLLSWVSGHLGAEAAGSR